jgi:hypothetical protein
MSINRTKYQIFYVCKLFFICSCILFPINGCKNIDDMISPSSTNPTPDKSPNTSKSSSTSESSSVSPTSNSSNDKLQQLVKNKSCSPPNQSEYISGNYKLDWTAKGSHYEGLLEMKGEIGTMRIKYFNEEMNKTDIVDQTMILANCVQGLVVFGNNPVIADTDQKHSTYSPDNLIFRREINGDITITNKDDQGVSVPVEMEKLSKE